MTSSNNQRTQTVETHTTFNPNPILLHLKPLEEKEEQTEKPKVAPERRVTWTEDTIDNQHSGNLKSNLCCIYHDPNNESSDTCTSDDEGNALERDRQTKKRHKAKCSKYAKKQKKSEGQDKNKSGCCKGHK